MSEEDLAIVLRSQQVGLDIPKPHGNGKLGRLTPL
jgi:hypothetical protein